MKSKILSLAEVACLSLSYLLIASGQVWLYFIKLKYPDFFERLRHDPTGWIQSHLLLMAGAILLIPATYALFKISSKSKLVQAGTVLNIAGISMVIGQYAIDFAFIPVLRMAQNPQQVYDGVFSFKILKLMFYDLPALSWLGQLLIALGIVINCTGRLRIVFGLFIAGLLLLLLGEKIHPIIPRVSYIWLGVCATWAGLLVARSRE